MADAMAGRAAAAVALDTGDPTRAAEHASAAALAADEIGAPVEAALARILAGRALTQLGQREHALTELRHAAATLHACGARRYGAAADQASAKHGRPSPPAQPCWRAGHTGLESLTERELQVAHLIVDRRTNAEIADALFLSPKTVETHIRNIFHKLDVSSRVDLARTVERLADPAHRSATIQPPDGQRAQQPHADEHAAATIRREPNDRRRRRHPSNMTWTIPAQDLGRRLSGVRSRPRSPSGARAR